MKPTLQPYLNFDGQTAAAMKFYQSVLGGELEMQTFSETGAPISKEKGNDIMHAVLKNDLLSFMASDRGDMHQINTGDNIHMSIMGTDDELLTKYFNGLSEGGKIDMPLAKQMWGDKFGMLTDKFGVHWMINITSPENQSK